MELGIQLGTLLPSQEWSGSIGHQVTFEAQPRQPRQPHETYTHVVPILQVRQNFTLNKQDV